MGFRDGNGKKMWTSVILYRKIMIAYEGDESFLSGPTGATDLLCGRTAEITERRASEKRSSGYGDRGGVVP